MISNINYPSIDVSMNTTTGPVTVKKTVTNGDTKEDMATYTVTVEKPAELEVNVTPSELKFTADAKKLDYQVTFSAASLVKSKVIKIAILLRIKKGY
ncbi:CO(2)-response secreted protease [Bienertia sinuspersici]